ncbi:MAG: aldehyde dehydrogenase family protein [Solirubrobacterales bacterium]|nr:aldehyde dehydrogenase family protein [Solirubrobacterales bacterium]
MDNDRPPEFPQPTGRTLLIDGAWRAGAESFARQDPADLATVTGTFARARAEDVADAYAAAGRAAPGWAGTTFDRRATVLHEAARIIERNLDTAAERLTADMGKAIGDARLEVQRAATIFRYFAGELSQPTGETYDSADPSTLLLTLEDPVGVTCAITPWNFPFAIPAWKLAPAIGFGNTVVWKPAEAASGSAVFLARALQEAGLPDGVLNLITGYGRELSSALTSDPALAAITFTGSGGVGNVIRRSVADRNVKIQLELGGKNPAVVLADADLDLAADQIARGAMLSTGQRCTATSRAYVDGEVWDEFVELLRGRVEAMTVGDPRDPATDLGPAASLAQKETVDDYLALAREEGATFVCGVDQADHECFVSPTVLTGVSPGSRLVREEIFGPVVVLLPADGLEDALAQANDTEFGLSSTVFTRDLASALEFVRRSESGVVHVNRETAGVEPHVPFGGLKGSSTQAREQGKAARRFFTSIRTAYVRSG